MAFPSQIAKKFKILLKKITIFDTIVVGAFFLFLIAYSLFFKREVVMVPIRVKVTDQDILYAYNQPQNWYADAFTKGDKEADTLGRQLSVITDVEQFSVSPTTKTVYLDMNVRASYDNRTKQYTFKGKPLVFGTSLRFNLSRIFFDSIVVKAPGEESYATPITLTITAELKSIPKYKAISTKSFEGQGVVNKDGKEWFHINKVTIDPADAVFQFVSSGNDLRLRTDSEFNDVRMEILVNAKEYNGTYYAYESIPTKIGESFPINFPEISILPIITSIEKQPINQ